MKPTVSVLLPAMQGLRSVAAAIAAWRAQEAAGHLEILLLYPERLGAEANDTAGLPENCVLIPIGDRDLHDARALGVERAQGEFVMLAEDHCLPDRDWLPHVLARIEEGWDGIGSALRPGNRTTPWARGSFLIGYGEWMSPVASGPTEVLCGWNGTIRRSLLLRLQPGLGEELIVGAFAIRSVRALGARFYLEAKARMRHFDPSGFRYEVFLLFLVGLGFGGKRVQTWAWPLRCLYFLAMPAIGLLHIRRAWRSYARAGKTAGLDWTTVASSSLLGAVWGAGEALGAIVGLRAITPFLWRTEVKPVSLSMEAASRRDELVAAGQ